MIAPDSSEPAQSNIVCSNCGELGHVYRMCPHPVTSYGVICFRIVEGDGNTVRPEYLMVQRKDSLGFVEFVRGKYDVDDLQYIGALLVNMTVAERAVLRECPDMDRLWAYLWRDLKDPGGKPATSPLLKGPKMCKGVGLAKDLDDARSKFERIRGALPALLDKHPSEVQETEWGFPKGRRNMNETVLECACREFQEETGLPSRGLKFVKEDGMVEEMFQGSNGVWYRHVYFLARATPKASGSCDPGGKYSHCNGEIRAVSWFSYQESASKIRAPYHQRRRVLEAINDAVIEALKACAINNLAIRDSARPLEPHVLRSPSGATRSPVVFV